MIKLTKDLQVISLDFVLAFLWLVGRAIFLWFQT